MIDSTVTSSTFYKAFFFNSGNIVDLYLSNLTFSSNIGLNDTSGFYYQYPSGGSITTLGSRFLNNTSNGGPVISSYGDGTFSFVLIKDSEFSDNVCQQFIVASSASMTSAISLVFLVTPSVIVDGCTFLRNSGAKYGPIYLRHRDTGGLYPYLQIS